MYKAAEDLLGVIKALPKDRDSYGLVHADLGPTNYLIDGERINVFDFDDCAYTWFAHMNRKTRTYNALWIYSLTPPAMMPVSRLFWKNGNAKSIGRLAAIIMAYCIR